MVCLLLYLPGLHAGYIQLFEKYRHENPVLMLVGPDILADFPILKREIRAIDPLVMQRILAGSGYFQYVGVADKDMLLDLAKQNVTIVLSNEHLSDQLIEQYLSGSRIIQENIFLRFDEKSVKESYGDGRIDCSITKDEFILSVANKVLVDAKKSSDWFRQIGAALISFDPPKVLALAHNTRMPTDQSAWLVGDPRMYLVYGQDTHLRTSLHAEELLLAVAAKQRDFSTEGTSIIVSTFPCPDCVNLIVAAGIRRCYFLQGYSTAGSLLSLETLNACNVEVCQIK